MKIGAMYRRVYPYPTYVYLGSSPLWRGHMRIIVIQAVKCTIVDRAGLPDTFNAGQCLTLSSLMAVLAISDRLANTGIPIPIKLAFTQIPRDTTTNPRDYTHGVAVDPGSSTRGTYAKPS